jgi:predicted patatin/cPLA2 family phospholipase
MRVSQGTGIGLILEGGGMRAGFVAGVLMALADYDIMGFDKAVAVSASVPTRTVDMGYRIAEKRMEEIHTFFED